MTDQTDVLTLNDLNFDSISDYSDRAISVERKSIADGAASKSPPQVSRPREKESGGRLYKVWYGTNRAESKRDGMSVEYSSNRSNSLNLGYCEVLIPKSHKIGTIKDAWLDRFPKLWESNRLSVVKCMSIDKEKFSNLLSETLGTRDATDRSLLIFIHGYRTTFDNAAIRAAQLGFDLGVRGETAFFSWPSKGSFIQYLADGAAAEASEAMLVEFLELLIDRSGAEAIDLIAHSMGNRTLLRSFSSSIARLKRKNRVPLRQIFLAAPDVDVDTFQSLASVYQDSGVRTTMYASAADLVLRGSSFLHMFQRAGYAPPITVVRGVDTVDVSQVDLSFLGHGYITEHREILRDMHLLMENDTPPERRFGLETIVLPIGKYWKFKS